MTSHLLMVLEQKTIVFDQNIVEEEGDDYLNFVLCINDAK